MKIVPDRLYLDINSPFREVVYYRPKGDNAEYIRADLVHPPERHQRLVEAARGMLNAVTVLCGDEYSCFSTCSLANECDEDDGDVCLWVTRLRDALEGEG